MSSTESRVLSLRAKTVSTPIYIGQTGRCFGTRLSGHQKGTKRVVSSTQNYTRVSRKQSQSELSKSAIAGHAVHYNHVID